MDARYPFKDYPYNIGLRITSELTLSLSSHKDNAAGNLNFVTLFSVYHQSSVYFWLTLGVKNKSVPQSKSLLKEPNKDLTVPKGYGVVSITLRHPDLAQNFKPAHYPPENFMHLMMNSNRVTLATYRTLRGFSNSEGNHVLKFNV